MSDEKENEHPSTLSEAEAEAAVAKAAYEAAKEEADEAKPDDGTLRSATISDAVTASESAADAETAYEAAKAKVKAARATSEAIWKAEYEAAKAEAGEVRQTGQFSNKRKQERIFRREMGEPEFFLMDRDIPLTTILTGDEIEEIGRKVQTPKDQTPQYNPQNILSPEFGGTTNYETGITDLIEKAKLKLDRLLNDPEATQQEIELAKQDLKKLNYLYDNYNLGMNVFRTAKGGRDTLRE
jgi:colicin import membrane protein